MPKDEQDARAQGGLCQVLKGARKKFICLLLLLLLLLVLWLLSIAFGRVPGRSGAALAIIIDGCFQYLIILRIRHVARFQLAASTVDAAEAVAAGSLTSSACWRNNQQLYYECTNTSNTAVAKAIDTFKLNVFYVSEFKKLEIYYCKKNEDSW